jgi:hypothetical protein
MAFDILSRDGKDLRSLPLQERLAQLEMLLVSAGKLAGIGLVPSFDDGQALMNACMEHSLEGVVSKAADDAIDMRKHEKLTGGRLTRFTRTITSRTATPQSRNSGSESLRA